MIRRPATDLEVARAIHHNESLRAPEPAELGYDEVLALFGDTADLPTIKHTGNMPADFTGVVYNDTGKNNYAAMVNGQWIKRKDGRTRWFKYEMEAARVAYHELHKGA